ncbi:MAG: type II and III secretion system protein family protein [Xanthobacteraceae bacterium]
MKQAMCFAAAGALMLEPMLTPALAANQSIPVATSPSGRLNARPLALGIGKSVVIDLPRDVKDVLVADPKIANAVVRSAQRAYIIGATVGQTNIVFFDADGQQIAAYDIAVTRDLNGIRAMLKQVLPNADIRVEGIGPDVVLSGTVGSQAESQTAFDIAARLLDVGTAKIAPEGSKVVNAITVRGRDQVMLKVVVAEVQRNIIKQLGVDLSANMNYGTAVVNFNNSSPFTANGGPLVTGNAATAGFGQTTTMVNGVASQVPSVQATVRAMESAGVMRTLAEPNLTAISGESANFLAGGEFPVPTGGTINSGVFTPTVTFKKFGISLNFTPVVLSEGRISLRVSTEVSEISNENAVQLNGTMVPSIRTRRADTTLEIPSGGSMAMAGLIQQQTKQAINGMPGLMRLPILGTLFRSRDYVNNNTELMVLVTPYIVRAVAQKDLSRPDDGFVAASDPQADLLGSINRIYGVPGRDPADRKYRGTYGFITD